MLELRPTCENCNKALPPHDPEARICSYECTFCAPCVTALFNVCPNCGGGFTPRPIRPSRNWKGDNYLGKDPNSTAADDLRAVERTLLAIRPYIRAFASGGVIEQLASGQACVAFGYSGDVIQAAVRAEEAGRGVKVEYVAGREGAQLWHDMLAIPADAPNADNAHAFINFLLRPDVMAEISNKTQYPNAVPASWPLIRPEVRGVGVEAVDDECQMGAGEGAGAARAEPVRFYSRRNEKS